MGFPLECKCGQILDVSAAQCGMTAPCNCGAQVRVPSLSKLRELSGGGAFESSVIDSIVGMIRRGELPAGDRCAVSGQTTGDVLRLSARIDKLRNHAHTNLYLLLMVILAPKNAMLIGPKPWTPDAKVEVAIPLLVSAKHQAKVRRASQRALKRWLRGVPIYAKLLEEYPGARIRVD